MIRAFACVALAASLAAWPLDGALRELSPAPGTTLEVLFTPGDPIEARLVALVDGARSEVLVNAYSFTSRSLARALATAHARGVRVEVIADRAQTLELAGSVIPTLARQGVAVWLDGHFAAAHNKVVIVDAGSGDVALVTGSYNFTAAARKRNAENVLIVRHDRALAALYRDNFIRLREGALRYDAAPMKP